MSSRSYSANRSLFQDRARGIRLVLLILGMLALVGCKGPYYVEELDLWLKRHGSEVEVATHQIDYQITREAAVRRSELSRKIEAAVARTWEELGEEGYQSLLSAFDAEMERYAIDSPARDGLRLKRDRFSRIRHVHRVISFTDPENLFLKARGQVWAEVEPDIKFIVVKPNAPVTYPQVYSVDIPPIEDNILLITIPVKFAWPGIGDEDAPLNQSVFKYCMEIIYQFMEEELTREQIDQAVQEVLRLGRHEHTWLDVLKQQNNPDVSPYQAQGLKMLAYVLELDPRTKVTVTENGKEYIFKYSSKGTLVIEYRWY
ncbi:MAG TPA: hypothetical protein GX739_07475 [Firmicutes bacterium]|nr:hypothetical protein [Bacillota bacterium]